MSDVDRPWDAPAPTPETPPEQRRRNFYAKIAVAVAAILLVGWCSVETKNNMDESDANGDERGATRACQEFVSPRLKSPGTADFSSESATNSGGPKWTVTGVVDSQNSFGGTVRNGYRCTITSTGDDNWRLDNVQTDGN